MTQALTLDATLRRGIGCLAEAKTFLSVLHREGKMFHLEDSPEDIIGADGELIFTPEQCGLVRERVRECYRLNWGDYECPIGYALELINDEER
jgi:hypothetical protein